MAQFKWTRHEFLVNFSKLILYADSLDIKVVCFTFKRSVEEQAKCVAEGKSKTLDGAHIYWHAGDIALWDDVDKDGNVDTEEIRWKDDPRYEKLGIFWESLGGVWGGRWEKLHDIYHFQSPSV